MFKRENGNELTPGEQSKFYLLSDSVQPWHPRDPEELLPAAIRKSNAKPSSIQFRLSEKRGGGN